MKNNKVIDSLLNSFLLEGISREEACIIFDKIVFKTSKYIKNDIIFSKKDERFGLILRGSAYVIQHMGDRKKLILNKLTKNNTFGMSTLFSENNRLHNTIEAIENIEVMFIEKDEFKKLLIESPKILDNYLCYTSNRIQFLNEKIYILSMGTAQQKICYFLLNEYIVQNKNIIPLQFSKTQWAQYLSIGRQSLYREISSLENLGAIKVNNNIIEILDLKMLSVIIYGD